MKQLITVLIGPLFLWACSADPRNGINGQPGAPISQQAADSISGNEGIVESGNTEVATGGSVVEVPVEVVKPGSDASASDSPKAPVPPVAQVPGDEENENTVTAPGKITGAFLVGEVIPNEDSTAPVRIGVVAKQDNERLSQNPDRFSVNWNLAADEGLTSSVRLLATKDAAYDRILEFDGTLEDLNAQGDKIAIHLVVSENVGVNSLRSVVKTFISELFADE